MVVRWSELTSAAALAVTVAEAKTALRVVDTQSIATRANRSMGTGNSQLLIIAKIAGTIGNQYAVRILVSGLNTALAVSFANNLLTITSATNGAGAATSTVNDIIAKVYADASAQAIFDATAGAGNGTGVIVAAGQANLTAGVDSGDEDAYLNFMILAATEVLENCTNKFFIRRTVRAYYDNWPCDEYIELPIVPVSSVEEMTYLDSVGDTVDILSSFTLDAVDPQLPARLILNEGETLPVLKLQALNRVQVDFTAGYGTSSTAIPNKVKQCILFLVGHWYLNREPVVNGTAVLSNKVPFTFETVLNSFRLIGV